MLALPQKELTNSSIELIAGRFDLNQDGSKLCSVAPTILSVAREAPFFFFVIFFIFLELNRGIAEQFFQRLAMRRISSDFEHLSVKLDVFSVDKTFHDSLPTTAASHPADPIELDQWVIFQVKRAIRNEKRLAADRFRECRFGAKYLRQRRISLVHRGREEDGEGLR
jgi:hypothetical protein